MRFLSLGSGGVRIILDTSDMERLGVCYESIDYSDTHTKKIIWELIDKAKARTGFQVHGEKLKIQVYPSDGGGCEMYISKLDGEREIKDARAYVFDDFESSLAALSAARKKGDAADLALYEEKGRYYIITDAGEWLCEYGSRLTDELWQAYLSEYAYPVARGEGIERLLRAFGC